MFWRAPGRDTHRGRPVDLISYYSGHAAEIELLLQPQAVFLLSLVADLGDVSSLEVYKHVGWPQEEIREIWVKCVKLGLGEVRPADTSTSNADEIWSFCERGTALLQTVAHSNGTSDLTLASREELPDHSTDLPVERLRGREVGDRDGKDIESLRKEFNSLSAHFMTAISSSKSFTRKWKELGDCAEPSTTLLTCLGTCPAKILTLLQSCKNLWPKASKQISGRPSETSPFCRR
jgi:hypothetical protein